MLPSDLLEVRVQGLDCPVRLRLLTIENPDVVGKILALIPLQSFLLHVVIAGETVYCPIPSLTLDSKNMVERRKGIVYYNATSQPVCFCYGTVTESTLVNQFGQVINDDLGNLERLGKFAFEQTISKKVPSIVAVTLQRPGDNTSATLRNTPSQSTVEFHGDWRSAKDCIDRETSRLGHLEEPDEIKAIRLGATQSRAGSEGSVLQTTIFLQGFLSTMDPHIFSRLLIISKYHDMTLPLMVRQTRDFLITTFNHFDFLADCGLGRMKEIGRIYNAALETLGTLEEYRLLTDSVRTLIQLWYHWLHLVSRWYLKDQFPARTLEEIAEMPKLQIYGDPR